MSICEESFNKNIKIDEIGYANCHKFDNNQEMLSLEIISEDEDCFPSVAISKIEFCSTTNQEISSNFKINKLPTVSNILSHFYANIYGHINNSYECERGIAIHDYLRKFLQNEGEIVVERRYASFYNPIVLALANITQVYSVEGLFYSKAERYQGRWDCLALLNNKLTMIEFKTTKSKNFYKSITQTAVIGALMQAAAYAKAFNDLELDNFADIKQVCVIVGAEDSVDPIVHTGKIDKYFNLFKTQLNLYVNR